MKAKGNLKIDITIKVIACLLLIFAIPLQIILQKPLMDNSVEFIKDIQSRRTYEGINFFKLFNYLDDGFFMTVVAPGVYNFVNPKKSPYIIFYIVFIQYITNLIALIFHEIRPFWFDSSIKGEICSPGYGNPSEITMISSCSLLVLIIEIFHSNKYRSIPYITLIIFITMSSFSNIYLGENFPHQIITTLFLSLVLVTFYFTLSTELSKLSQNSCYNYYENRIYMMYWTIFIFILLLIVFVIKVILSIPPGYYSRLVSNSGTYCDNNYMPEGIWNVKRAVEVVYCLGFVYGSLYTSKYISIYSGVTKWWKNAIRYIVTVGINVGIVQLFSLFSSSSYFDTLLFNNCLPCFLLGICGTGLLPHIFLKVGLISKLEKDLDTNEPILDSIKDKTII
jgi:PAP2 superfamily